MHGFYQCTLFTCNFSLIIQANDYTLWTLFSLTCVCIYMYNSNFPIYDIQKWCIKHRETVSMQHKPLSTCCIWHLKMFLAPVAHQFYNFVRSCNIQDAFRGPCPHESYMFKVGILTYFWALLNASVPFVEFYLLKYSYLLLLLQPLYETVTFIIFPT